MATIVQSGVLPPRHKGHEDRPSSDPQGLRPNLFHSGWAVVCKVEGALKQQCVLRVLCAFVVNSINSPQANARTLGRARTGTPFRARDFKSPASTIPPRGRASAQGRGRRLSGNPSTMTSLPKPAISPRSHEEHKVGKPCSSDPSGQQLERSGLRVLCAFVVKLPTSSAGIARCRGSPWRGGRRRVVPGTGRPRARR